MVPVSMFWQLSQLPFQMEVTSTTVALLGSMMPSGLDQMRLGLIPRPTICLTSPWIEGDISNLCQYGWYEWCYFRDQTAAFPNNKEVLGRVLGPARGAGNEMAQWILKASGRDVPRRSLRPLKVDELHSPVEIKKRELFDELIKRRWGTPMTPPNTQ